jgi:hypothetical protein
MVGDDADVEKDARNGQKFQQRVGSSRGRSVSNEPTHSSDIVHTNIYGFVA